ncbi:extradiol ring-cleavage dioxygenase [Amycolatopsis sp. WAC 04169]|uniref:VOC family protein n=1 Tax=Amycolatopsis sp. WAC 04169 TaxID=2203197 RepID=UPI000F794F0E|nr:VOC family protein [Amycolatopsis sp. WAC 04169]RSN20575.1 extradiol ring-cleavage dioxygenase [Amycolatopsis sp. WAC 04169]
MITHLRSVEIHVTNPAELLSFYEDVWGLAVVEETDDRIRLRGRGTEHHVLTLATGEEHRLGGISLAADGERGIAKLTDRLRGEQVELLSTSDTRVEFLDPEGRRIEVACGLSEHTAPSPKAHGPDRLSHVVLNSVDLAAAKDFYTRVLGFEVSDTYENDQMVFLRCNSLHHCVVLAPGKWTSLNHVAYEVRDTDEVMKALGRLRKAGFDTVWGPGRHGPGGNVFCYFLDPAGNVIEYTAELLEVGDDWVPGEWARTPENADVWGTGGGITPAVIEAMSNPPREPA